MTIHPIRPSTMSPQELNETYGPAAVARSLMLTLVTPRSAKSFIAAACHPMRPSLARRSRHSPGVALECGLRPRTTPMRRLP